MFRRFSSKILPVAVMSGLALGGCSGSALASWYGDHKAEERHALADAETTAGQAVDIAQTATGGRAMRVAFDSDHGHGLYRLKTMDKDGKVMWVLIDAATGRVAGMREEGIIDRLTDREDRLAFARLTPSAVGLDAAIAAARKESGGTVLKAAFSDDDGRQAYDVRVVVGDHLSRLLIDPGTGGIVKKGDGDD